MPALLVFHAVIIMRSRWYWQPVRANFLNTFFSNCESSSWTASAASVDVAVEKWKRTIPPFIKRRRFNGLRFQFLMLRNHPIAPKKGIDNLQATL
jgi:hypothetical protein